MPAPLWKTPRIAAKVQRGLQRRARASRLDEKKDLVRRRDRTCRMPMCGCRRFRLQLHVSHRTHEGMGGNPAEDRSDPATMVLVCCARHREHRVSIDRRTLRWEPLTSAGANGPIRWLVDMRELMDFMEVQRAKVRAQWVEVARETGIGAWEPFTPQQEAILRALAKMVA